jgi:osmotically-inducible protein OsmY
MIRAAVSVFLLFALVVPSLAPALLGQDKARPVPSDDRIYDEVRRKLANDAEVKGAALDVQVKEGVVTLRGQVPTAKAKEKATTLSKKVKGVTNVDNQLTLLGAK